MKKNFFAFFETLSKLIRMSVLASVGVVFCGCLLPRMENVPYGLSVEKSEFYGGESFLDFTFENLSGREIRAVSLVLSLSDREGKCAFCEGECVFEFEKSICAEEEFLSRVDFEDMLDLEGSSGEREESFPLYINYFYVSKLVFFDGSVWEDPLGRFSQGF